MRKVQSNEVKEGIYSAGCPHTVVVAVSESLSAAVIVPLRCSLQTDCGIVSHRAAVTTQFHYILLPAWESSSLTTPNDGPLADSKPDSSDTGVLTGSRPPSPFEAVFLSSTLQADYG